MFFRSPARSLRFVLCTLFAVLSAGAASAQPVNSGLAQHFGVSHAIPGRYIVMFKDDVANAAEETDRAIRTAGDAGRLHHRYRSVIKGFAATLSEGALSSLRNNPNVLHIEQDQTVSLSQVENSATWGLDRVDQADRPLDTQYHYNYTGAGVNAFIIDTGIRASHAEFAGRVLPGFSSVSDRNGTNDCNGHGTHVAGTVGGTTWGVAKEVKLIPVRVLNCAGSGTWSGVIAGIDWVANSSLRPAVANLSLGGGFSAAVNAAVAGAVAKGVTMAVAAGNDGANACNYSPASEPSAITVGATASTDARASYSNIGTCVDIFAPGSGITSAWNTSNSATKIISGTSMATPHVTGVAALATQANPGASPAAIAAFLTANATVNRLALVGAGSPNLLLFSLGTGVATPPPVQVVAVTALAGSSALVGRVRRPSGWQARATITVRDIGSGVNVANARVTGTFAPGGAGSCVTASTGSCTLSTGTLAFTSTISVFTVTGISGNNMAYDAGSNSGTQITIAKP